MRRQGILPVLVMLLVLLLELPLLFPSPAVGDNFQFWAAGHAVITGASPYARSTWEAVAALGPNPGGVAANTAGLNLAITREVWLYPPQTAFLFAPFGALPFETGVPLLHIFVAVTAIAAIIVAAWAAGLRGPALAFALALAVVSEPFVLSVRNGHPIGLLVIGGVLLLRGLDRRDYPALAIGAALITLKPQLLIPMGVAALVIAVARRDMRALLALAAAAVFATLPFELLTPFPMGALVGSSGERLAADLSTIPALARDLGGGTPLALALAALTVSACVAAFAAGGPRHRRLVAGASLFVLSLALAPYAHDYDMLVAVPAMFAVVALGSGRGSRRASMLLATIGLGVVPWLLFYWWPIVGDADRRFLGGPLGGVPIAFAATLLLAAIAARRSAELGAAVEHGTPNSPERQMA